MTQEPYTIRRLADYFRVSRHTIAGEIRRGELDGQKERGHWLITQAQLEDYITRHTVTDGRIRRRHEQRH